MKRLIIIVSVIFATIPLCAQKAVENDAVFVTVGANVPMYKNIEGDVVLGLHYAHYYSNGVGFRTGFQYIPTVVDIDNSFSLPLAISYRTGSRSRSQKLTSAANSVAQTQTSCDGLFLSDQTGGAVDLTLCDVMHKEGFANYPGMYLGKRTKRGKRTKVETHCAGYFVQTMSSCGLSSM